MFPGAIGLEQRLLQHREHRFDILCFAFEIWVQLSHDIISILHRLLYLRHFDISHGALMFVEIILLLMRINRRDYGWLVDKVSEGSFHLHILSFLVSWLLQFRSWRDFIQPSCDIFIIKLTFWRTDLEVSFVNSNKWLVWQSTDRWSLRWWVLTLRKDLFFRCRVTEFLGYRCWCAAGWQRDFDAFEEWRSLTLPLLVFEGRYLLVPLAEMFSVVSQK